MPASAKVYVSNWRPAWTQINPRKDRTRMMIPPMGKKRTNASPMIVPCAIRARVTKPLSKPWSSTDPPMLPLAGSAVGELTDAVPVPVACAEATKGLRELPPLAFWRLKFRFPMLSCSERLSLRLFDFAELPLKAHIQDVLLAVRSMVPVPQFAQLEPTIGSRVLLAIARPENVVDLRKTTYSENWQSSCHWRYRSPPAKKLEPCYCIWAQLYQHLSAPKA